MRALKTLIYVHKVRYLRHDPIHSDLSGWHLYVEDRSSLSLPAWVTLHAVIPQSHVSGQTGPAWGYPYAPMRGRLRCASQGRLPYHIFTRTGGGEKQTSQLVIHWYSWSTVLPNKIFGSQVLAEAESRGWIYDTGSPFIRLLLATESAVAIESTG